MISVRFDRAVLAACFFIATTGNAAAPASVSPVSLISQTHAEAIYRNILERHWVPSTGLFLSFPDSSDRKLAQQASTYEQGAMGLLALQVGDTERARGIFNFLKTAWNTGPQKVGPRYGLRGLTNFYNAEFGGDGIEKTIHLGPNAWAGLFAARLANTTHDPEALQWAMDVAYWIANGIPHENGAVAMGAKDDPQGAPWAHVFSTENNLSYYAFLTELLRSPGIAKEQRASFTLERDRIENWILAYCVDATSVRVLRGYHPGGPDKMQALDTITWLISAIGPKHLAARGIDPYALMQSAEKRFEVTVGGRTGVDPADQAEADMVYASDHPRGAEAVRPATDRHRMIWYEGLGQYIVAWTTLADYSAQIGNKQQAARCLAKAQRLQEQFDLAALPKYSNKAAYAYGTPGKFFRDGWRTPAESVNGPASSLISAVWRAFAGLGVDPLAGKKLTSVQQVKIFVPKAVQLAERQPAILYGTSEDMVVQAWRMLDQKKPEQAIAQAQATIQEWAPWAQQLQRKKMADVGHTIDYSGDPQEKRQIFSYWALNDVGAAYFILGRAYDAQQEYVLAAQAFQQVLTRYSLAQVWDPNGWFWTPAEAVASEYVARNEDRYGAILPQELAATGSTTGKRPY